MSKERLKVQLSKFQDSNRISKEKVNQIDIKDENFEIINLGDNCAELSIKSDNKSSI